MLTRGDESKACFDRPYDDLIAYHQAHRRDTKKMEGRIALHLTPFFGRRKMTEITVPLIRQYVVARQRDAPRAYHVYCDESQTNGARFMVYGGLIVPSANVPWFKERLVKWRQATGMTKELKWTKVSKQKYAEYASLIDLLFEFTRAGEAAFKSLVIDTSTPDYARYRTDNPELGFYKGYCHFLHRDFGPYARTDEHSLHVLLDQRPSKYKVEVLQIILNRGIRKSFKRNADVVKRLQEGDSKQSDLLQLTDVVMGAVGFHCNGLHSRPDASAVKVKLADYVAKKARLNNLHAETRRARQDFEIRFFRAGRRRWFRPRVPKPPGANPD